MSVPVLSMHRTSTRASTSTAGSSWTSTRRLASRTTPTANATLVRSTRPSGTIATVAATEPRSASRTLAFERSWLTTTQRRGRDQQPRHDPQDLVDPAPQLRTREAEPPPLLGELRRVRLRADTRGPEPSAPRRDERPREHLVARRLDHGLGLAGQQRLVDLERGGLEHLAVDHDLIARLELEHVVEDDLGERHLADLAVADDPRVRRRQHRQRVERPLRAQLLVDPDAGVRDQHEPEQRVLDRADDQGHHQERAEQRVEPREDVGSDDLPDRARGDGRHVVDLAARDALGDLLRGQALGGGHGARYRTPGVSRSARHHSSS